MLPKDICDWITRVIPRRRVVFEDSICWNHPKEGDFTVKSAYKYITEDELPVSISHWNFIWKWLGNQRTRTFLWLCAHDKILTNNQRVKRNLPMVLFANVVTPLMR